MDFKKAFLLLSVLIFSGFAFAATDINISSVVPSGQVLGFNEVYLINFTFGDSNTSAGVNANATIDTNIYHVRFDINYAPTATAGTGTVIVNDANVGIPSTGAGMTAGFFCDSNSSLATTTCHFPFTVPKSLRSQEIFFVVTAIDEQGDTASGTSEQSNIVGISDATITNNIVTAIGVGMILIIAGIATGFLGFGGPVMVILVLVGVFVSFIGLLGLI